METIKTTLTTTAAFSDDGSKRYLLTKTWEEDKPSLAIIMLAPSEASGIVLDSTTLLVLNNAARLGYGSVTILNLFATLNDFAFRQADDEDSENLNVIVAAVKEADAAIYVHLRYRHENGADESPVQHESRAWPGRNRTAEAHRFHAEKAIRHDRCGLRKAGALSRF